MSVRALMTRSAWMRRALSAVLQPGSWIAQRRFETLPLQDPTGRPLYPCIGVYVVDGRASGCYARLSRGPITDFRARDAALLIVNDP